MTLTCTTHSFCLVKPSAIFLLSLSPLIMLEFCILIFFVPLLAPAARPLPSPHSCSQISSSLHRFTVKLHLILASQLASTSAAYQHTHTHTHRIASPGEAFCSWWCHKALREVASQSPIAALLSGFQCRCTRSLDEVFFECRQDSSDTACTYPYWTVPVHVYLWDEKKKRLRLKASVQSSHRATCTSPSGNSKRKRTMLGGADVTDMTADMLYTDEESGIWKWRSDEHAEEFLLCGLNLFQPVMDSAKPQFQVGNIEMQLWV